MLPMAEDSWRAVSYEKPAQSRPSGAVKRKRRGTSSRRRCWRRVGTERYRTRPSHVSRYTEVQALAFGVWILWAPLFSYCPIVEKDVPEPLSVRSNSAGVRSGGITGHGEFS